MSTAQPTEDLSKRAFPHCDQLREVTRPSGGTRRALTYGAFGSGLVGSVLFAEHICSNCVGKHEDPDNDCRNSALTLMATSFIAIAAGYSLLQSNGAASARQKRVTTLIGMIIMAAALALLTFLTLLSPV